MTLDLGGFRCFSRSMSPSPRPMGPAFRAPTATNRVSLLGSVNTEPYARKDCRSATAGRHRVEARTEWFHVEIDLDVVGSAYLVCS